MPDDSPLQPAPEPAAPAPEKSPNLEFADKLLAIERQRAEAERLRLEEREQLTSTVGTLKDEVRALREKLEGEKIDPNDPWAQVSDEQLASVLAKTSDDEGHPGRVKVALDELLKRRERKTLAETDRRRLEAERRMMELAQTEQTLRRNYGNEIMEDGSELRKRAQLHMQAIQRQRGEDARLDPQSILLAASLAHNDILRAKAEKAKEQEQELARMKSRAQMEGGNKLVHKPGEDTKSLLKAGKVDQALKSLNLFQRLFQPEG